MAKVSRLVKWAGPYGLYALARFLCRRQPRILMYHRFSESPRKGFASREVFREQVAHIKRHYQPMTLRDLSYALFEEGRVPKHAIVLTIDDGYRDFYDIAYPILQEYEVPATFFVTTGFINGDLWLWHDHIEWLLDQVEMIERPFSVGEVTFEEGTLSAERKRSYWRQLSSFLLRIYDCDKHRHIAELGEILGVALPAKAPDAYQACSWGQLREMEANCIEIGGHTVTHPSLGKVSTERARLEIHDSMSSLTDNLGFMPRSFCYPNGQSGDYSIECMSFAEDAGYVSATVAFQDGVGTKDRYALRRHSAGDGPVQFAKAVSGLQFLGKRLSRVSSV